MRGETKSGRRRIPYAIAACAIVVLGLLWRSHLLPLSPFLRKYGGDSLWAAMVYALIRLWRPPVRVMNSAGLAFGIAVIVEFSQIYHAPWIDAVRHTRLGALALGDTFNWPDIAAYAAGVALAALADLPWRNSGQPNKSINGFPSSRRL